MMGEVRISDGAGRSQDRLEDLLAEFRSGVFRRISNEDRIPIPHLEERTGMQGTWPATLVRMEHRRIREPVRTLSRQVAARDPAARYTVVRLWETLDEHHRLKGALGRGAAEELLEELQGWPAGG